MTWKKTSFLGKFAMTRSVLVVVAAVLATLASITGVSAITSKSGTSVIKTTLQIFPPESVETTTNDRQEQPSFAARYWQKQRAISTGPSDVSLFGNADVDEIDESILQPPHKLSAAQQAHILEDVRRHNQHQQWWTASGSADTTLPPSPTVTVRADNGNDYGGNQPEVTDQLQQLLQINGVAAVDDDVLDSQDEDRQSKQRSIGTGGGATGWQPQSQPSPVYNRQPQQPSLSPYVPTQPTASHPQHNHHHQQNQHHQQQYNPTASSVGPIVQQSFFVTTPSSAVPVNHNEQHHHKQQQPLIPFSQQQPNTHKQQYFSQNTASPSPPSGGNNDGLQGISIGGGLQLDADIEHQIRQKLTAVVGTGGNYTILAPPGKHRTQQQQISGLASTDNIQYVQIGGGSGSGSSRNRLQQQFETSSTTVQPSTNKGNRNTIVKTVVVRQKPTPQPTTTPPPTVSPVSSLQQQWMSSEQQQLEQLARQVLPPGVAQYEIIRAGGEVDGAGAKSNGDAIASVSPTDALSAGIQQPQVGGKKKPVTFVILEERPDGTVRVRGIEKKQHGTNMGTQSDGGDVSDSSLAGANDEQLQQLVDKLNRGELRLPGSTPTSKNGGSKSGTDSVVAASTTAAAPLPSFIPSFPSTVPTPSLSTNNNVHKLRDPPSQSSPYFPPVTPQTTTAAIQQNTRYQNFFLPTTVPTAAVAVTPTAGQTEHPQQNWHQQQYYSPPAITTAASSTPSPSNTTISYHKNKASKDGTFSGALRRRGYYAMAKYMRQAGIDSVLEDTGPFTLFVPTDKAFRALLVQLGGPDRAEEKFHENPRLLIGLLLHHVVPGAFKAADLKAGDEMTGVSLAGTQLRANLYARQLYDNRWNDIEVLTVNGARVLDDVIPAGLDSADDGSPNDFIETVQQRRDMVLAPNGGGPGSRTGENQQIMAIAHAIDRVLFPLPVGDVLATMRADRQRRYSVFLRAVDEYCSASVRALLTGSRTVTVFAPVDEAFRVRRGSGNHNTSTGSILDGVIREDANGGYKKRNRRRVIADRFVLSHVVLAGPGDPPMYTAGLRFYQVRDTAYRLPDAGAIDDDSSFTEDYNEAPSSEDGHGAGNNSNMTLPTAAENDKSRYYQLTIYKDSGRIRLNGGVAQVTVRNVPATNGVLHGIDAPLV